MMSSQLCIANTPKIYYCASSVLLVQSGTFRPSVRPVPLFFRQEFVVAYRTPNYVYFRNYVWQTHQWVLLRFVRRVRRVQPLPFSYLRFP